ncbi:DUF2207 domain-containing protein [Chelativorans sp. ZYF759]|uniref:DUF2207 domain-containing protein n=1 Tax=Chelativorans sp. ZYF759 TaxID=2692213 RepID=UPI00145CD0AD|nr:DUF2207 domain-containing protein [Chelativorans sp. ZYF759]NMG38837.1 DUF2207 domain-containing protein [Chelativorans sp. ZYF759]
MRTIRLLLVFILAGLAGVGSARAAEEIRAYHADIAIGADGTLEVVERIRVNVEGREIRRGIFRDIPLRFEDADGRLREAGLDITSVTRNGAAEPYTTERGSGMLRVRIGDADVLIPHGEHIYEIAYRSDRQIRFFEDHDELYWNVTGNGWDFPILEASAEVRLPGNAAASDVTYFTGALGSTEQAASAQRLDGGNRVRVTAERPLGPREGLTVVVAMQKGVVAEPSAAQERAWWLRDNAGMLAGIGGLLLVLAYYGWAWSRVGRDPPAGVMVPRWDPPDGISPALTNYIDRRGFRGHGWEALSAAVLNLAVRGLVELDDLGSDLTIRRTGAPVRRDLPVGEAALIAHLGGAGDTLTVDKANGTRVQTMGTAFRNAIEKEHSSRFYRHNWGYVVGGLVLSAVSIGLMLVGGGFDEESIGLMIGMTIPAVVLSVFAISLGKQMTQASTLGARIASIVALAFAGFVCLTLFGGFLIGYLMTSPDLSLPIAVGGLVMTNFVFFRLMGAPTPIGRKMMDGIAGLRQYLTFAEKDRMNMQGAPEMSPAHYERLLPYAVALGVEKPWSQAFQTWLAAAVAAGAVAAYTAPAWYRGSGLRADTIGSRLGALPASMASSFTASLPAPKSSSSGFSGGSSGGGGGGGGGGGW